MDVHSDFFSFQPFENLLFTQSWGAWDGRVAQDYAQKAREVVLAHYQRRNWAVLHDGRQWELGTPEIEQIVSDLMTTRLTGTLTHHAYVAGPSQLKLWQMVKISKPVTAYEHRLFETIEEAEAWLASFGYTRS